MIFEIRVTEYKMCVLIHYITLPDTFLILRRNDRDRFKKMYIGLHVKYPLFLSDFNETCVLSTDFRKVP